jgi:hypothetical protein
VAELEPKLSLCGLDIKTTRNQETGQGMYVLVWRIFLPPFSFSRRFDPPSLSSQVNTIQDEPAKLATEYKPEEIALFKAIVRFLLLLLFSFIALTLPSRLQVEKIMHAPKFAYSVGQQDAIKCAVSPMTRTAASQVLKSFLAKGTLSSPSYSFRFSFPPHY